MEYASTEYVSTNVQGWKMQVQQLKEYFEEFTIFQSCISVDPPSVGLDQFTCTVPDRCYTQEIVLMLDSCAEGPGFKNRRRDAVE